jgi:hypothetical protein
MENRQLRSMVAVLLLSACGGDDSDVPHKHDAAADATSSQDLPAPDDAREASDAHLASDDTGDLSIAGTADAGTAPADGATNPGFEAGAPLDYSCDSDGDCCIKVDRCTARAYLYSTGPGASPAPSIPYISDPGQCLRCTPPAVQVRCESGVCVGQPISGASGKLTQDHCGYITTTDAGAQDKTSYGGAQPVSWGC